MHTQFGRKASREDLHIDGRVTAELKHVLKVQIGFNWLGLNPKVESGEHGNGASVYLRDGI
jgi:hypothetical protein